MQSKTDTLYLNQGDLKWSVIDPMNEVRVLDPIDRAGLQLVDSVASAFYQAAHGWPQPAIALEPRMATNAKGRIFGYGLKLMPSGYLRRARPEQKAVFEYYAAEGERQAPGP
jgi:hypothetical protein